MGTLVKIIVTFLASIVLSSCNLDFVIGEGKKGNGTVVTDERSAEQSFDAIKASEGIDVYVTQGNNVSIVVEADENIIEFIKTDIANGELKIHTSERLGRAKSKKVYVSLPRISRLETSSGADMESDGVLEATALVLNSSSGSDLKVNVEAAEIKCHSSSGANIKVSGTVNELYADASSGSDISATDLMAKNVVAKASSGADIMVNATDRIDARSSSGGDIRYKGDPEVIHHKGSFGGQVTQQ